MLNKGPYIRETLRFLNDVLGRMQAHHDKKTALLRKLSISDIPTAAPPSRSRRATPAASR
jgi:pyruvate kinase